MSVVPPICPSSLCARETFRICVYESRRSIGIPEINQKEPENFYGRIANLRI
jgi:hypothetical protein